VASVAKGGRRFSFSAIVVVGDGEGSIGFGLGKAGEVPEAIRKGVEKAKKGMFNINLVDGTIPYETTYKFKAAKVFLKPAPKGTGIIAGGSIRTVLELAGITDIVAKRLGSTNKANNIIATLKALNYINSLHIKHTLLKKINI